MLSLVKPHGSSERLVDRVESKTLVRDGWLWALVYCNRQRNDNNSTQFEENKVAVKFADLYYQRISIYEARPDLYFYFLYIQTSWSWRKTRLFLMLNFSNLPTDPSPLASPQWILSSERLNAPLTLQPELESMALFSIFVIVSVRWPEVEKRS